MPGSQLCIPRNETVHPRYFQNRIIMFCLPTIHLYICERLIYFQDQAVYFAEAKYVDRSWEYINRSQTHECRSWDWGLFWEYLNWVSVQCGLKKPRPVISCRSTFKNFLHHIPCYLNVWRWRFCAALWKPLAGFARAEQSFKHNLKLSAFINSQYRLYAFINLILPDRLALYVHCTSWISQLS